jgi:hypothetical protein
MAPHYCKLFLIGWVLALAPGCSTADFKALDPAPPFAPSPVGAAPIQGATPGTVTWWQYSAADLAKSYQERYAGLARMRPVFDLPLIGLAASAVGALFYGAPSDAVFGIGLGAGVLGATRTYLNFGPAGDAYLAGSSAAQCVAREVAPIVAEVTADGTVPPDLLKDKIGAIQTAITAIDDSGLSTKPLPAGESADALRRFNEAQTLLRNGVQAAREAIRVAHSELSALNGAPSIMGAAVNTIENKVAKRVAFQAAEFGALQSQILDAVSVTAANRSSLEQVRSTLRGAQTKTVGARAAATAALAQVRKPTIEDDIQLMQQLLDNLSAATFDLTEATPQITAARAAILKCADPL